MESRQGIFRRKSSNSSTRSRLVPIQSTSCPTSPRQGVRKTSRSIDVVPSTSSVSDAVANGATTLHRSSSTISAFRPRSSPAGLYSYTGKNQFF